MAFPKKTLIPKKKKSALQQLLHPIKRTTQRADGVVRIVKDSYSNGKQSWWTINKQILERDDYRCRAHLRNPDGTTRRCTNSKAGGFTLEVHHVKPLSKGGKTISANLITLCERCHNARHSHLQRSRGKH